MVNVNDKPNRRIMAYGLLVVYVVTVVAGFAGLLLRDRYIEMIETVTLWVAAIYIGAKAVENLPRLQDIMKRKEDK